MRKPPLSIIKAVVASLRPRNSPNTSSSPWMSSSRSCGKVAMSCVLRNVLVDEFVEQHAGNHVEGLEYAFALVANRGEGRRLHLAVVEKKFHVFHGRGVGQVALVVLQNVRDFVQVELEALEIVREVLKTLNVLGHFLVLRIGDEHNAVHAAQHELSGGVVNDLARDGVELELRLEALDRHGLDGEEVEEERAVGAGGQRDEFALVAGGGLDVVVNLHEVGRLAAHCRAVIDDFDLQFFCGLIDDGHRFSSYFFRSNSAASAASCAVGKASATRPKAAKKMAFTRKIFHGTLPTVKFRLFNSPMRSSFVHWLTFEKIWGRNAASVSPFNSAGMRLATIRPSGSAMSAPATPSNAAARDTISFGVA